MITYLCGHMQCMCHGAVVKKKRIRVPAAVALESHALPALGGRGEDTFVTYDYNVRLLCLKHGDRT